MTADDTLAGEAGGFDALWRAYRDGEATGAELVELFAYIRDRRLGNAEIRQMLEDSGAEFERLWAGVGTDSVDGAVDPVVRERMRRRLMEGIQGSDAGARRGAVRLRMLRRVGVAAAIIGLLGLGWWWGRSINDSSRLKTDKIVSTDVAPGGNRAVLTLANGQKIVLDSAVKGRLVTQVGAVVDKTDSGELAYHSNGGAAAVYNTLTTPKGGQYRLTLADGTKVWLNAASSITYPTVFTGGERRVSMTGEAYFEVAGSAAKPFRVEAGGEVVEVLGTAFNLNAYTDEPAVNTTLVLGAVRVWAGSGSRPVLASLNLKPGQQALFGEDGVLALYNDPDLEKTIAWKEGVFLFERDELPAILRQLARWYDVDVRYVGKPPAGHYSGIIDRNRNLSQVLEMLRATNKIHFTIDHRTIVIEP